MFTSECPIIPSPDREIVSEIARLCFDKDAYIAGGAALAWFSDLTVSATNRDVDVFFQTKEGFEFTVNQFKKFTASEIVKQHSESIIGIVLVLETENAYTYRVHDAESWCVFQLIKNQEFSTPYELVNRFDLSVSQIATDGEKWFISDSFARDYHRNRVSIERIGPGTAARLIKYCVSYGFQDAPGSFTRLARDTVSEWKLTKEYYHGL